MTSEIPLDSSSYVENSPSLGHFSLQAKQGNRSGAQSKADDVNEKSSMQIFRTIRTFKAVFLCFLKSSGTSLNNPGSGRNFMAF